MSDHARQFYRVTRPGFAFAPLHQAGDYVLLFPEQAQYFLPPYTAFLEPVGTAADGDLAANLAAFRATYLGAVSADPPATVDGEPLAEGARYWNTATQRMRVLGSQGWADEDAAARNAAADAAGSAIAAGSAAGFAESARRETAAIADLIVAAGDLATTKASEAAVSAADAASSATTATTKSGEASASTTAAAGSAAAATTKASEAAASATDAASAATTATTKSGEASASATAAANSAAAAAASAAQATESQLPADWTAVAGVTRILNKPTTLAGFGITDAAPLNSPALAGAPTAPTGAQGQNTNQIATQSFVIAALSALVNGAPGILDTLGELATALQADQSAVAALTTALAGKQAALNFTPVQQGTGTGQLANTVKVGWSGARLKVTVDGTDLGNVLFDSHIGSSVQGYSVNLAAWAAIAPGAKQDALGFTPAAKRNRAYAEYTANADLPAAIPIDDTIPQITEGTQILAAVISASSPTNRVRVHCEINGAHSAGNAPIAIALFLDGNANAIACGMAYAKDNVTYDAAGSLLFEHVPGDTNAHTYSIRVGAGSGTVRLNGSTAGRVFGGAARCALVLEEIAP